MTIKARPTVYNGIEMRSRLEAAFAQWLDTNSGLPWEYEPSAFASAKGQYLPDFVRPGQYPRYEYFEVKPFISDEVFDQALERMHIILDSVSNADLSVVTSKDYESFWAVRSCTPKGGCGKCERGRSGPLFDLIQSPHGPSSTMHCGHCFEMYTHLRSVDHDRAPANCGRDDHLALELTFWCETCDFLTIWNIHNHKGETYASFTTSPAPVGEE